ncbi:MAG TPA: MFS transporter [Chloroflexi bacterium]|nr:MFS transporter [Chloroflexota bacterium]HHW85584.1 multidrug efflux MFS transporter [Chloroflexota bacterium]
MTPPINWRRNLAVLSLVQVISTLGFGLIFPFLPLYVRDLGVSTTGSLEFWAGLAFSAQAFTMMIASPIWGTVADRSGRKLMLERATLGGAIIVGAMGFVQNAEQLVLLRALQGATTGVIAANNALVAAQTPKEHSGFALGVINMARWVGVAGGPLVGGVIGELFGFRESFWLTGALLGVAGLAVVLWVQEDFHPVAGPQRLGFWASYRAIFTAQGMRGLYSLAFLRSLGATVTVPILALFVLALNEGVERGAVAMTGLIIGVAAFTSAVSAVYLGRLGDRIGHERILFGSAMLSAVLFIPQVFVTSGWQLAFWQAVSGVAIGGLVPSVSALMNIYAPAGNQGATYGLDNSVQAAARVVAPMLAAALATWVGYRGVFVGAAAVYGVAAIVARLVTRRT